MVLVQKWPFLHLIFLSNLDQENFFYDILERKNAFLRYKNKKSKEPKNWYFSKGVNGPCTVRPTLFLNFLFHVEQTERYEIEIFFDLLVCNVTSV